MIRLGFMLIRAIDYSIIKKGALWQVNFSQAILFPNENIEKMVFNMISIMVIYFELYYLF